MYCTNRNWYYSVSSCKMLYLSRTEQHIGSTWDWSIPKVDYTITGKLMLFGSLSHLMWFEFSSMCTSSSMSACWKAPGILFTAMNLFYFVLLVIPLASLCQILPFTLSAISRQHILLLWWYFCAFPFRTWDMGVPFSLFMWHVLYS